MLEQISEEAEKAAREWLVKNNMKAFTRSVIENRIEEVVAREFGFDDRWGDWELDQSNARHYTSEAGHWLRDKVKEEVKSWLDEQAGKLPELPKTAIKSLLDNYRQQYHTSLKLELMELARKKAKEDALKYFQEYTGLPELED